MLVQSIRWVRWGGRWVRMIVQTSKVNFLFSMALFFFFFLVSQRQLYWIKISHCTKLNLPEFSWCSQKKTIHFSSDPATRYLRLWFWFKTQSSSQSKQLRGRSENPNAMTVWIMINKMLSLWKKDTAGVHKKYLLNNTVSESSVYAGRRLSSYEHVTAHM